jgi:hypothetical protein
VNIFRCPFSFEAGLSALYRPRWTMLNLKTVRAPRLYLKRSNAFLIPDDLYILTMWAAYNKEIQVNSIGLTCEQRKGKHKENT